MLHFFSLLIYRIQWSYRAYSELTQIFYCLLKSLQLAGFLGTFAMLSLSFGHNLQLASALLCLMGGSATQAIADVTIDACVTENSISHPSLASDMQSLCGVSSSIGQLIGYTVSGFLVHLIGSMVWYHWLNSIIIDGILS
uniref:Probable folate-biopterin transporter 3 n=1 Tax=Nicotiana tabacum TaxID=4097 RepID=A0A1S3Z775_TOBAC|nr:PREDICTED: probable folate-biopterin transporter 3 [Nicotiana tabacum]